MDAKIEYKKIVVGLIGINGYKCFLKKIDVEINRSRKYNGHRTEGKRKLLYVGLVKMGLAVTSSPQSTSIPTYLSDVFSDQKLHTLPSSREPFIIMLYSVIQV